MPASQSYRLELKHQLAQPVDDGRALSIVPAGIETARWEVLKRQDKFSQSYRLELKLNKRLRMRQFWSNSQSYRLELKLAGRGVFLCGLLASQSYRLELKRNVQRRVRRRYHSQSYRLELKHTAQPSAVKARHALNRTGWN